MIQWFEQFYLPPPPQKKKKKNNNNNNIGFPGQIRKFDNQIHFKFIQIRQILSCRENYHSYSFSYHSI